MDTSNENIDKQIERLQAYTITGTISPAWAEELRQLLHAVRSERNMLAYEKGGHQLWKRYTS